jgi:peptidoglycan/LPS O-acetylase OafA/YrhL
LAGLFAVPLVASAAPWYRWTSQGGVFRALPSFLFGMLLFELRVKLSQMPFPRATCWGALLLFLVGAAQAWPAPVLLAILYLVVAMGVAADVQRRGGKPLRLLAPWGKLTYSVYMLHGLVMIVLLNVLLDRVLFFHGAARNAVVVLAMLAVMPVSYLSYTWFETPARRWLGGERRLRPPQSAAAKRVRTGEILAQG